MTAKTAATPATDLRAEALALAEKQLDGDRDAVLSLLPELAQAITEKRISATSAALARLAYLEHRITQAEMMATALWCRECAATGASGMPAEMPPPPAPWMVFECVDHFDISRSARSWQRSLFGGLV